MHCPYRVSNGATVFVRFVFVIGRKWCNECLWNSGGVSDHYLDEISFFFFFIFVPKLAKLLNTRPDSFTLLELCIGGCWRALNVSCFYFSTFCLPITHRSINICGKEKFEVYCRDHFVDAPSQWETTLQCNIVPHCLGAHTNDRSDCEKNNTECLCRWPGVECHYAEHLQTQSLWRTNSNHMASTY